MYDKAGLVLRAETVPREVARTQVSGVMHRTSSQETRKTQRKNLSSDRPVRRTVGTPTDPPKFRLVFTGECYLGHDPQAVREAVVAALKLDEKRAARLFSGRRVVLRKGVDLPAAHRYIVRLSALGAVVHAEPPLSSVLPVAARDRPTAAPAAPRWRRQGLAAAGVAVAIALLLVPVVAPLWPGADPAAPAPGSSPPPEAPSAAAAPPAMPSVTAAAPALPPVTPAMATRTPAVADLPQDATPEARQDYFGRYLKSPGHKAFAISASRHHGWHAQAATEEEARGVALDRCMAALRPGDEDCRVIDEDGELQE